MKKQNSLKRTDPENKQWKSVKLLKKSIYLAGFTGLLFGFNACMTSAWVESEPVYIEHSRPQQPTNLHIWIDGDWGWNRSQHAYVQQNGHWDKPRQNSTYVTGHWQKSEKGHSWKPGRWKRNDH